MVAGVGMRDMGFPFKVSGWDARYAEARVFHKQEARVFHKQEEPHIYGIHPPKL
jgi:hypothetical protein